MVFKGMLKWAVAREDRSRRRESNSIRSSLRKRRKLTLIGSLGEFNGKNNGNNNSNSVGGLNLKEDSSSHLVPALDRGSLSLPKADNAKNNILKSKQFNSSTPSPTAKYYNNHTIKDCRPEINRKFNYPPGASMTNCFNNPSSNGQEESNSLLYMSLDHLPQAIVKQYEKMLEESSNMACPPKKKVIPAFHKVRFRTKSSENIFALDIPMEELSTGGSEVIKQAYNRSLKRSSPIKLHETAHKMVDNPPPIAAIPNLEFPDTCSSSSSSSSDSHQEFIELKNYKAMTLPKQNKSIQSNSNERSTTTAYAGDIVAGNDNDVCSSINNVSHGTPNNPIKPKPQKKPFENLATFNNGYQNNEMFSKKLTDNHDITDPGFLETTAVTFSAPVVTRCAKKLSLKRSELRKLERLKSQTEKLNRFLKKYYHDCLPNLPEEEDSQCSPEEKSVSASFLKDLSHSLTIWNNTSDSTSTTSSSSRSSSPSGENDNSIIGWKNYRNSILVNDSNDIKLLPIIQEDTETSSESCPPEENLRRECIVQAVDHFIHFVNQEETSVKLMEHSLEPTTELSLTLIPNSETRSHDPLDSMVMVVGSRCTCKNQDEKLKGEEENVDDDKEAPFGDPFVETPTTIVYEKERRLHPQPSCLFPAFPTESFSRDNNSNNLEIISENNDSEDLNSLNNPNETLNSHERFGLSPSPTPSSLLASSTGIPSEEDRIYVNGNNSPGHETVMTSDIDILEPTYMNNMNEIVELKLSQDEDESYIESACPSLVLDTPIKKKNRRLRNTSQNPVETIKSKRKRFHSSSLVPSTPRKLVRKPPVITPYSDKGEVLIRTYRNGSYITLHVLQAKNLQPSYRSSWKLSLKISLLPEAEETLTKSDSVNVPQYKSYVKIDQKFSFEIKSLKDFDCSKNIGFEKRKLFYLTLWKRTERNKTTFLGWTNVDFGAEKKKSDIWLKLRSRKKANSKMISTPKHSTTANGTIHQQHFSPSTKTSVKGVHSALPYEITTMEVCASSSTSTKSKTKDLTTERHGMISPFALDSKPMLQNSSTMDSGVEDCCNCDPKPNGSIGSNGHHQHSPCSEENCPENGSRYYVRMTKDDDNGFGFSVVWVSPPRIERIEKNKAADVAGLKIGDLIISVNREDVSSVPNTSIYHKMKTTGNELELEVWRRHPNYASYPHHHCCNDSIAGTDSPNPSPLLQNSNNNGLCSPNPPLSSAGSGYSSSLSNNNNHNGSSNLGNNHCNSTNSSSSNNNNVCPPTMKSGNSSNKFIPPPISILKPPPPPIPLRDESLREDCTMVTKPPQPATSSSWKIRFNVELLDHEDDGLKQFFICELKYFRKVVAALDRYLIPAQANCLLTIQEMHSIFSRIITIITITKRILQCIANNSASVGWKLGEILFTTHSDHISELVEAYSNYGKQLGTAATILANKMTFQLFAKFVIETPVPKGHLDMTSLLFAPLEHLRNLCEISDEIVHSVVKWGHVACQLKECYADLVCENDFMEPITHVSIKKQPLLSVRDLEKRIVSTNFQDFKVNEKGRKWLFGSRLFLKKSDGSFAPVWAFLFTDIIVLTTHHTTRDRVFFVKESPIQLEDVVTLHFNIPRKNENEFRLLFEPEVTHTSRFDKLLTLKSRSKKSHQIVLRTPNLQLKSIWKLLLQRQIITLNTRISKSSSSNFSISEFCEKFPENTPEDEIGEPILQKNQLPETSGKEGTKPNTLNSVSFNNHSEIKQRAPQNYVELNKLQTSNYKGSTQNPETLNAVIRLAEPGDVELKPNQHNLKDCTDADDCNFRMKETSNVNIKGFPNLSKPDVESNMLDSIEVQARFFPSNRQSEPLNSIKSFQSIQGQNIPEGPLQPHAALSKACVNALSTNSISNNNNNSTLKTCSTPSYKNLNNNPEPHCEKKVEKKGPTGTISSVQSQAGEHHRKIDNTLQTELCAEEKNSKPTTKTKFLIKQNSMREESGDDKNENNKKSNDPSIQPASNQGQTINFMNNENISKESKTAEPDYNNASGCTALLAKKESSSENLHKSKEMVTMTSESIQIQTEHIINHVQGNPILINNNNKKSIISQKPVHTDSPIISGLGSERNRRRLLYDYKVRRDYPELFGITPRDRRSYIKSLGEPIDENSGDKVKALVTPYFYVSPAPSPLPIPKHIQLEMKSNISSPSTNKPSGHTISVGSSTFSPLVNRTPPPKPSRNLKLIMNPIEVSPISTARLEAIKSFKLNDLIEENEGDDHLGQKDEVNGQAERSPEESSSNDSGISDEMNSRPTLEVDRGLGNLQNSSEVISTRKNNPVLAQASSDCPMEKSNYAESRYTKIHSNSNVLSFPKGKTSGTVGTMVAQIKVDKSTETEEQVNTKKIEFDTELNLSPKVIPITTKSILSQRREAFFLNKPSNTSSSSPSTSSSYTSTSISSPNSKRSQTSIPSEPIIARIVPGDSLYHSPVRQPYNYSTKYERVQYKRLEEERVAKVERVESSDESTSSDAASASPAGNENGTTEPSWSSSTSSLVKEEPCTSSSASNCSQIPIGDHSAAISSLRKLINGSTSDYYHLTKGPEIVVTKDSPPLPSRSSDHSTNSKLESQLLSTSTNDNTIDNYADDDEEFNFDDDEDAEFSNSSIANMGRYGTYESLEKIDTDDVINGGFTTDFSRIPRSKARFTFDEDEDDEEDLFEEDFESDFNFRFPTQVQDNTYSKSSGVSRLGPLPPLLEEDYEDEVYDENSANSVSPGSSVDKGNSSSNPATSSIRSTRHFQTGVRGDNNFLLTRIATMYARSSISPLKIFRDLWLKKRYRQWNYKE